MAMRKEFERINGMVGSKKGQSIMAFEELDYCVELESLTDIAFLNRVIHWTVNGADKCYRVNNTFASEVLRCSPLFFKKVKKRLLERGFIDEIIVAGYPSEFKATNKTMVMIGLDESGLPY